MYGFQLSMLMYFTQMESPIVVPITKCFINITTYSLVMCVEFKFLNSKHKHGAVLMRQSRVSLWVQG